MREAVVCAAEFWVAGEFSELYLVNDGLGLLYAGADCEGFWLERYAFGVEHFVCVACAVSDGYYYAVSFDGFATGKDDSGDFLVFYRDVCYLALEFYLAAEGNYFVSYVGYYFDEYVRSDMGFVCVENFFGSAGFD